MVKISHILVDGPNRVHVFTQLYYVHEIFGYSIRLIDPKFNQCIDFQVRSLTCLRHVDFFSPTSETCRPYQANTRRWSNVGLMLGHRLRRWPNIKPALGQRLVFSGIYHDNYPALLFCNLSRPTTSFLTSQTEWWKYARRQKNVNYTCLRFT